jgi:hypothetical protein
MAAFIESSRKATRLPGLNEFHSKCNIIFGVDEDVVADVASHKIPAPLIQWSS